MLPEKTSMPVFIIFDTQTGYLYGHLLAEGPEDPFLHEIVQWWSTHCSVNPVGLDDPGVIDSNQVHARVSSN